MIGSAALAIALFCGLIILGFSRASPDTIAAVLIYAIVATLGGVSGALLGHIFFPALKLLAGASIGACAWLVGLGLLHLIWARSK